MPVIQVNKVADEKKNNWERGQRRGSIQGR
jgi:hypothetical protein